MIYLLLSTFFWTLTLAGSFQKAAIKKGKITGRIYYLHLLLTWIILMCHTDGIKRLGWVFRHFGSILETFFVPVGPIPAWLNFLSLIAYIIGSHIAMYLSFALAQRKNIGRRWLLRLLPFLYFNVIFEGTKVIYGDNSNAEISLLFPFLFYGFCFSLFFVPHFFFYNNKKVISVLFSEENCEMAKWP
jgi:hypothetical protein